MNARKVCLSIFTCFALGLFGCASTLTYFGPLKSKLVTGARSAGPFDHYEYKYYVLDNDTLKVVKTSMCMEMAEKLRVAKLQERGFYLAVPEIAIFGLGFFDMLQADAIVQNSKKVEFLAKFPTGRTVACSKPVPASGEPFVVEDPVRNVHLIVETDNQGRIFLDRMLPRGITMDLKFYPKSDPSAVMTYSYNG